MTTPLMGWLPVISVVDAFERNEVALIRTATRRKVKIILELAKIKTILIRIVKLI
jgi:hypothetical protein